MYRKSSLNAIFLFVALIVLAGFIFFVAWRTPRAEESGKIKVVASFYPLAFFAEQIGRDQATVTNITPAGAEPHDYEPTAADIARIEQSNILILIGSGFEAWDVKVTQNISQKTAIVYTGNSELMTRKMEEDGTNVLDPHVWLSPLIAQEMVDVILRSFIQDDPLHREVYETNATILKAKLIDLDRVYRDGLKNCIQKDIITSHAAFGYLAATYHLREIPIAGLSPDEEPSPTKLAQIAQFARKNTINYIFFESLVSPKLSETIAREIGARTLILDPIEGLTDEEITQGKNYFTQMQQNLTNLKLALQCQP